MEVHRGLDGNRRVFVERPDRSRVFVEHADHGHGFAERGGRGYVEHPYEFHGQEYGHRTYYEDGRVYDRYYRHYGYHGVYYEVYAPVRYFPLGFYAWVYNPWFTPTAYAWGWGGDPWFGYYGWYFQPYPTYAGPAYWLTDYMIATSLRAAYEAQLADAQMAAAYDRPPPLSPQVKELVAAEVRHQMEFDRQAAVAYSQGREPDPASGSVVALLNDGYSHTFVAGTALDVVDDTYGRECMLSNGDVVQVGYPPPPDSPTAVVTVLASKGGIECLPGTRASVALVDLQGMQNHMREQIEQGLAELSARQGAGGLPPAPPLALGEAVPAAYAVGAPPPDESAAAEIRAQAEAAEQAEAAAAAPPPAQASYMPPPPAAAAPPPPTLSLGQTPDEVVAVAGQPNRIVDLGAKKIYTYPDMKVYFQDGRVVDIK